MRPSDVTAFWSTRFNAPAVVLGRGRARGLLSPSDEAFTLGILFSRLDAPYVAVPDPRSATARKTG